MKRRSFLRNMGAVAAAPFMPKLAAVPALAEVSPPASHYLDIARLMARAHNRCSCAMLARHLRVDAQKAEQVRQLLVSHGVITQANAQGISVAVNPIQVNPLAANLAKPATQLGQVEQKLKHVVDQMSDPVLEDGAPISDGADQPKPSTDPASR